MHMKPCGIFCCVIIVIDVFDDVRDRRDGDENVLVIVYGCRFDDSHGMSLGEMILAKRLARCICFASRCKTLLRQGVWLVHVATLDSVVVVTLDLF